MSCIANYIFLVLASASADMTIKLWDFQGYENIKTLHGKFSLQLHFLLSYQLCRISVISQCALDVAKQLICPFPLAKNLHRMHMARMALVIMPEASGSLYLF